MSDVYSVRLKTGEDLFFTLDSKTVDFSASAIKAKNVVEFYTNQREDGQFEFALIPFVPYLHNCEYLWLKTDNFVFEPQEVHENFKKEYDKRFSTIILPPSQIIQ